MPVFKHYEGELVGRLESYRKRGAQEGGSNRPPTPATQPDQNEAELEGAAHKHVNDEQHLLDATLTEVTRLLTQTQQNVIAQRAANQRLLGDDSLHVEVEAHLAADRQKLVTATELKLMREADLNRYRKLNAISDSADYPESVWWHLAIIAACMVLETLANSVFFENEQGLVGGALVAVAVSAVNMATAGLFGFLFRFKNLPAVQHKVLGWAAFVACLTVTLYCNALFAAFRTHYQAVTDPSDAKEIGAAFVLAWNEAMRVFVLDYAPSDMLGFLLFVIGIGLSILAFWKGYTLDDPHPGYGRRDRRYRSALRPMQELETAIRSRLQDYLVKNQTALQAALGTVSAWQNHLAMKAADVEAGRKLLVTQTNAVQRDFTMVLKAYRDANLAVRVTPAPSYFTVIPDVSAVASPSDTNGVLEHVSTVKNDLQQLRDEFDGQLSKKLQSLKNDSARILNDVYTDFLARVHTDAQEAINAGMPVIGAGATIGTQASRAQ